MQTAWSLAREHGLAGLSLRDLARHLGMAAPSLYSYFSSKFDLYDAMFEQGYREFLALGPLEASDLRTALAAGGHRFADFCVADPTRYQLLFQRTIPGFEPSEQAYGVAKDAYAQMAEPLHRYGLVDQSDHDLVTAVFVGIVAQQLANEPSTTRWTALIDRAVDMLADHFATPRTAPRPRRSRR